MIVFTLFGMLVLASIIGLIKYKYDNIKLEQEAYDRYMRSDYYDSYESCDEPDYDALAMIAEIEDNWDKQVRS